LFVTPAVDIMAGSTRRPQGGAVPEPISLVVLGGLLATEGVKFLFGQATEVLKAWRERRRAAATEEELPAELDVPITATDVLDGTPTSSKVDVAVVTRELDELTRRVGELSLALSDGTPVDAADEELAASAGALRELLEEAYGQRLTLRGEQREPTGTRVQVRQRAEQVSGRMTGVQEVSGGADVSVDQQAGTIDQDGSVLGVGRIS
jgi:hypothetical protein